MNFPTGRTGDCLIPILSLQDAVWFHSCAFAVKVPEPLVSTRTREQMCMLLADLMCFVDEMAMHKTATSNNQGLAATVPERGQSGETCGSDGSGWSSNFQPRAASRGRERQVSLARGNLAASVCRRIDGSVVVSKVGRRIRHCASDHHACLVDRLRTKIGPKVSVATCLYPLVPNYTRHFACRY